MPGILTLGALGASLSVDAFAAALGKGAVAKNSRLREAARVGLVFGIFEAATPALGWLLGYLVNDWIADWDHWVSFVLLVGIGAHMIHQAYTGDDVTPATEATDKGRPSLIRLSLTALATSIDAAAVGITLALMDVNLWLACAIIGGVTAVVATGGVMIGNRFGPYLGRCAEVLGGVVLALIGASILYQHLSAG